MQDVRRRDSCRAIGSLAQAHFPFIVPDEKGTTAKVVFSDTLDPDTNVNIEKLANTKLTLRDATGKESPVEWKKGEGFYSLTIPGSGTRVVYGITDYGVLQKGDAKPFKLTLLSEGRDRSRDREGGDHRKAPTRSRCGR